MLDDMNAKKKPASEPSTQVVRLPVPLLDRASRVGDAMAKRIGGSELPPAYVIRAALERGLDALEEELGVKRK